jgi:hypothetical protein
MTLYNYIACFFAGAFLCNFVPHFVKGVSGDRFPTPFANPPAKGLSRPYLNVFWALFNLVLSLVMIWYGKVSTTDFLSVVIMFLGFSMVAVGLSLTAENKYKE